MCGICGIYGVDGPVDADEALLTEMNGLLTHRGPDAEGYYLDDRVALGHRRLKIIDLTAGAQPMHSGDGRYVIVFNGEIYNYAAIRTELKQRGHVFSSNSDTEVLLAAFIEYGEACLEQLRGMFAFAIYDRRAGTLFLARDRVGIKPLYYRLQQDRFVFASEVKPLLAAWPQPPSVDSSLIDLYFSVGYVPGDRTLFEGVRKLPPAHHMWVRDGEITIDRYWDLETEPVAATSFEASMEELERRFTESVRLRMVSDVPIGAFLSGGLDSSAIVALMSQLSDQPIKTFSVGYDDEISELPYARAVAERFGTEHHEYTLQPVEFFESIELLLTQIEEPIVEPAAVALYQLACCAREHATVLLSGEGGDEALAGYPLYTLMRKVDRLRPAARLAAPLLAAVRGMARSEKVLKYVDWLGSELGDRYQGISCDVTRSIKQRIYADGADFGASTTAAVFRGLFDAGTERTALQRMSYVDINSWLPDDLLIKADKMTMAASIELRVPFLDHDLLEYCYGLPDDFKIRGQERKYILKKLMEKHLPREIIYRKKQGFPVPIAQWFRGELYGRVRETLLDPGAFVGELTARGYIETVLERHRSGREDLSRRIFSLLTLETWHRIYIR